MKLRVVTLALILAILGAACGTPRPEPTPVHVPVCDATLWNHVYHPQRLQVIDDCIEVAGYILSVRQEKDGDAHVLLYLDVPLDENQIIVAEVICVYPVHQSDAVQACKGFHNTVSIPAIESHVSIVGTHVLDTVHNWEEIHPVTSMEVI